MTTSAVPTVLLVEDNEDARSLYSEFLRIEGFQVITAADGVAALAAARLERPDIVLMDVTMPGMDGFTATAALKDDPDLAMVPVIMLTAHVFPEHQRLAAAVGSDGFLRKPCLPDQLLSAIRRILAIH